MYYTHLKDFLEQSSQKAFWIFSYGNIAGVVAGFFVARYLAAWLPAAPPALLYPLLVGAGLGLSWVRQGQPAYAVLALWLGFGARRLVRPATLDVASGAYYRAPPAAAARRFALSGLVSYSGETTDGLGALGPSRRPARPDAPGAPDVA